MMKYNIKYSKKFKSQLKRVQKQGKNLDKLFKVIEMLAKKEKLDVIYKDHALLDNKYYQGCRECHIEPDWLLIYKYNNDELILYLVGTGSHSLLFDK